ncbi:hypothetical protein BU16DRAFT_110840 [Lophium mytilinum]|uniref:Uncharacterized protein n=1 Tax=Lophium mytilinum TaxID=390894 RepID=A0A6A6QK53_9PEZI|nr:hypothetical protein BU16DRAFT_110840 [Lophium mytilinum]
MELHALSGFIVAAIQPGAALADCRKQGSMCQLRSKAARLPWRPRAGGGECKEGALWVQVVRVVLLHCPDSFSCILTKPCRSHLGGLGEWTSFGTASHRLDRA